MESLQHVKVPLAHVPATLVEVKVTLGQTIKKGDVVAVYEHTETVTLQEPVGSPSDEEDGDGSEKPQEYVTRTVSQRRKNQLVSLFSGTVEELPLKRGAALSADTVVVVVKEPCGHAVQLHGLCALCGQDLTIPDYTGSDTSRATISMTHDASGVTVSLKEAQRLEKETVQRLLKAQKLSLILDLDQTILHATVDPVVGEWKANPDYKDNPALQDVHAFTLPDSPTVYYVKLRPNTRHFLEEINRLFELHIYTMGTRNYARAIAQLIDPDERLFQERILSRDESGSFTMKSIQRLFPCDQSMVVVVDDRADIWKWSSNLIKVLPYNFFLGIGDINAPGTQPAGAQPQPALTEAQEAQDDGSSVPAQPSRPIPEAMLVDNDNHLDVLLSALKELHTNFYQGRSQDGGDSVDVRRLLPAIKQRVLRGCVLLFTSVIPLGQDPRSSEIWNLATSFGATIVNDVTDKVTHVVAGKRGTVKVNVAKQKGGIFIVKPEWLVDSINQWKRQDESNYLIEPFEPQEKATRALPPAELNTSDLEPDSDEEAIVTGQWQRQDDVFVMFGNEDWNEMDKEMEEAMLEDDDDDEEEDPLGENAQEDAYQDDGDAFANEIEEGLGEGSDTESVALSVNSGRHTPPDDLQRTPKRRKVKP